MGRAGRPRGIEELRREGPAQEGPGREEIELEVPEREGLEQVVPQQEEIEQEVPELEVLRQAVLGRELKGRELGSDRRESARRRCQSALG